MPSFIEEYQPNRDRPLQQCPGRAHGHQPCRGKPNFSIFVISNIRGLERVCLYMAFEMLKCYSLSTHHSLILSQLTTHLFSLQVLSNNNALQHIIISCNKLGTAGGRVLQEGLENNRSLKTFDLRLTEISQQSEHSIMNVIKSNKDGKQTSPVC